MPTDDKYNQVVSTTRIYRSPSITPSGFNAIRFINKGRAACTIDGVRLEQYESIGWGHNVNEIDVSQYRVDFPDGYPANCNVVVIILYYNDRPLIGE